MRERRNYGEGSTGKRRGRRLEGRCIGGSIQSKIKTVGLFGKGEAEGGCPQFCGLFEMQGILEVIRSQW